MRIALFTDTFLPQVNGVANHVATLAEKLVERGHSVCVVSVSSEKVWGGAMHMPQGYEFFALPSVPLPVMKELRAAFPSPILLTQLRAFRPEIVHVHTPMAVGWMGVLAARAFKIPLIGTSHTFFDVYLKEAGAPQIQEFSWTYVMSFYNWCTRIIAPSMAMKKAFDAHGPKAPVVCVENGIDLFRFSPCSSSEEKERMKAKCSLSGKVVVYLGRLSVEKRVDVVIQAFARIAPRVAKTQLLLIGDGPSRKGLQQLARDRGVEDKVLFTGFLYGDDVTTYLRASDLFISGSQFENMPLSVLEAMACGLPVVAVRSLGMSDIIRDGVEGVLAEESSPEQLAAGLQSLLANDDLLEKMTHAARERSKHFSLERMVTSIEVEYQQACAETSKSYRAKAKHPDHV